MTMRPMTGGGSPFHPTALADVPGAVCLMTGGAAQGLAGRLNIPSRLVENLVLEGLVRFMTSQ